MADQLNWLNQHLLLLRYKTVAELQEHENYELPDSAAELAEKNKNLDSFIAELAQKEMYAEACGCLAYAMHKRAAVWWGYNVLLNLFQEPPLPPAEEAGDPNVPEPDGAPGKNDPLSAVNAAFEKVKNLGKDFPAPGTVPEATLADAEKTIVDALSQIDAHLAQQPQDVKDALQEIQTGIDTVFQQNTGMSQNEYWDYIAKLNGPDTDTDTDTESTALEDSLAKDAAEMESGNAVFEKEMAEQFPPMNPQLLQKRTKDAMNAVHAWCLAPDESNSLAALKAGNAMEDQPAGTLAQAAFWSYGDLAIDGSADCVVKTPPGLAASGVGIVILQAISASEGSIPAKERGAAYLALGLEIAQGKNNWSKASAEGPGTASHGSNSGEEKIEYTKWKG